VTMTSDVMHSNNYWHLEQIWFFHLQSLRIRMKAAGSSWMPVFTPAHYTSSHLTRQVSSSVIIFSPTEMSLHGKLLTDIALCDRSRVWNCNDKNNRVNWGDFFFSVHQNGSCFNIPIYFLSSYHLTSNINAKSPHFIKLKQLKSIQ